MYGILFLSHCLQVNTKKATVNPRSTAAVNVEKLAGQKTNRSLFSTPHYFQTIDLT